MEGRGDGSHAAPCTPHTPHTKAQTGCSVCVGDFSCAFMMSTNVGFDTATAAARRRQRRLRSWLRHERMTVAMTLAEKLHHTSRGQKFARVGEEVVHDAHDAPREPKTPPPGVRPGSLAEPGPQRSDRTVRRSSGDSLPTLALPSLAVDSSALRFLTASALEAKRKLEEEEKMKAKVKKLKEDMEAAEHEEKMLELNRRFQADLPLSAAERAALRRWIRTDPGSLPSSAGTRRKRKKRRKRRLPRTSSCPSRGRARCRQRQWHTRYAGFPGDVLLRAVFPSELLGILAGMDQKGLF